MVSKRLKKMEKETRREAEIEAQVGPTNEGLELEAGLSKKTHVSKKKLHEASASQPGEDETVVSEQYYTVSKEDVTSPKYC